MFVSNNLVRTFFFILFALAMKCEETPDVGQNLAAGSVSYSWDNSILYQTNISLSCLPGRAFDTEFKRSLINNCVLQSASETGVRWKYNADHALPACIRKFCQNVLILFRKVNYLFHHGTNELTLFLNFSLLHLFWTS